jgi:hypothetical protein
MMRDAIFLLTFALAVGGGPQRLTAATLQPESVEAWNAYVVATEARIAAELSNGLGFFAHDFLNNGRQTRERVLGGQIAIAEMNTTDPHGRPISVPAGLVHHFRGSVFIPGVTLDALLARLKNPSERGPHQEDVLALRVLAREPDRLKLFIAMTRKKIVTVTYHTEHDVRYQRHGPRRASSRSVATKIAEVVDLGTSDMRERPLGDDRGFLWRLNSYWRYEQVDNGVIVELESLTLSRDVPLGLRVVVEPLIDRIARESVSRTLDHLRQTYRPRKGLPIMRGERQGRFTDDDGRKQVMESELNTAPVAWSPDKRSILFWWLRSGSSLWTIRLDGEKEPSLFGRTASVAQFSPDGKWLAACRPLMVDTPVRPIGESVRRCCTNVGLLLWRQEVCSENGFDSRTDLVGEV